ncbi:unnamed protein product [Oncorhynchus mykiss]|uniref:C-type lectin domain-containing protein n=1 Tax=Oncorhynchus mykiss TaxID=8022 RepID=A0A060YXG1_ONCMY|nr:unnamed protein product [Oncorhynchus mykiss]
MESKVNWCQQLSPQIFSGGRDPTELLQCLFYWLSSLACGIPVSAERDQLQISLNTRTTERDQLQNILNTRTTERDQLQNNLNTRTTERDQLQTRLRFYEKPCLDGWWKFGTSCYYVSSTMDSSGAGQKECRTMGGELVIINSREEQIFIHGFKNVWIGKYKEDGIWEWVGKTPFKPT